LRVPLDEPAARDLAPELAALLGRAPEPRSDTGPPRAAAASEDPRAFERAAVSALALRVRFAPVADVAGALPAATARLDEASLERGCLEYPRARLVTARVARDPVSPRA